MSHSIAREFWANQSNSRHRADLPEIYTRKAMEHAGLFTAEERGAPALDIGCGAGELLEALHGLINVRVGIDYSPAMIEAARPRLAKTGIELLVKDVFEYLPHADQDVWMTTGAINQYLDIGQQRDVLTIFQNNARARAFFLFDCVDPLRYDLLWSGLSYRPLKDEARVGPMKRLALRGLAAAKLVSGRFDRPVTKMRGTGMGFGYRPSFWIGEADQRGLKSVVVSSQHYEYRYHVLLRK